MGEEKRVGNEEGGERTKKRGGNLSFVTSSKYLFTSHYIKFGTIRYTVTFITASFLATAVLAASYLSVTFSSLSLSFSNSLNSASRHMTCEKGKGGNGSMRDQEVGSVSSKEKNRAECN